VSHAAILARAVTSAVIFACVACLGACAAAQEHTSTPVADGPVLYRIPERPVCATAAYHDATSEGDVADAELDEASGIAVSPVHAGVLWSHNDSGDTARVFAIGTDGRSLGRISLPDVEAQDIEDIAMAPCPDLQGPCIYLADTGNNAFEREQLVVYAIAEPDVELDKPLPDDAAAARVWTFPLAMPDPPINVEAMVITPGATEMIFFEKTDADEARIFALKAPWTPDAVAELEQTGTFATPNDAGAAGHLVTGADMHPSATRIALRTYTGVYEVLLKDQDPLDRIEPSQLIEVMAHPPPELQGEAIAYDAEGTGLWTVSESAGGAVHPPLHHATCQE
jgi:hypothetical protein